MIWGYPYFWKHPYIQRNHCFLLFVFQVWKFHATDFSDSVFVDAGGYAIASALRWKGADLFAKSNLQDIYLNGEVAGQEKSGGGLTWIQQPGFAFDTLDGFFEDGVWLVVCCGYLLSRFKVTKAMRNPVYGIFNYISLSCMVFM